jgi:hypothetical protein
MRTDKQSGRAAKWFGLLCLVVTVLAQAQTYIPVPDTTLVVRDGSPLDFSRYLPSGAAGANGQVLINSSGRLAFANNLAVPAKLHCVSMAITGATGGYPDKAQSDILAHQIKVHGYNVVRFHYVEATLMTGRVNDFDWDPVQLDRFYYFLSALKREGVYWLFDMMSSENGAIGNVVPHRWIQQYNMKFLVQVDEGVRAHWRAVVDKLYLSRNPYTDLPLLTDPALAGVTMVNEGGMNYLALAREGGWRPELLAPFNAWMKKRYASTALVKAAWGDLLATESLEAGTLNMPADIRKYSLRMNDFQRFLTDLETDTARMMISHLRLRGYNGPLTSYDNWVTTQADATRSSLEWIDMHSYHDAALSFEPGARIDQVSAVDNVGRYLRWMAVSRQAGKPFSLTEFGQPFWNRYRGEGIMAPAMAAFQNWDFACQHAEGGVDLSMYQSAQRKQALFPYGVGMDPVARAVETVGALLYMRGDVAPAKRRISVQYDYTSAFKDNANLDVVPDDISLFAWITGMETAYPTKASTYPSPYPVYPVSVGTLALGKTLTPAQKAMVYYELGASLRMTTMRADGLIAPTNISSIENGLYQSDTGQLLIDKKNGRFTVITPRTEAVTTNKAVSSVTLSTMKLPWITTPAMVAASALDDVNLAASKKILLVYTTDADNTGMTFAETERKTLTNLGTVPVRVMSGNTRVTLSLTHPTAMKLNALTLTGETGAEVPMAQAVNALGGIDWSFTIDTSKFPTTFFLLAPR